MISISNQDGGEDKERQKHLAVVVTPTVLLFYRSTNKLRRTEAVARRSQSKYAKIGYAVGDVGENMRTRNRVGT